ncbi:hypothetical protein BC332_02700 [Capsicum chinense]|nr:hypothetical protein BC332_02700 [Capsicum chinense]
MFGVVVRALVPNGRMSDLFPYGSWPYLKRSYESISVFRRGIGLLFRIFLHDDGYYVVKLASLAERDEVLVSGPYTIYGKPTILKAWTGALNIGEEVLSSIAIWVKLPNLLLNYMSKESLSWIGSDLGTSLYVDACTTKVEQISYVKILVE